VGLKSVFGCLTALLTKSGDVTAPGSKDDFVKTATRLSYFDGRALRDLALSNDLGGISFLVSELRKKLLSTKMVMSFNGDERFHTLRNPRRLSKVKI